MLSRTSKVRFIGWSSLTIAIKYPIGLQLPLDDMNNSNFPLHTFGATLARLRDSIYSGRGFFLLRGWDSKAHPPMDNVIMYVGIAGYIAERRGRQNQYGMMISKYYYDILSPSCLA
jgi:hypothetical protein